MLVLKIIAVSTSFFLNNWQPSLAIRFSLLAVGCAIGFTLWLPTLWTWTVGLMLINHIILSIAGLIPRSSLLGPNITRLPEAVAQRGEVAITIDDGPDPAVTPQVLDILERYQAKASFFCIGNLALQYPELCREIVRRGHAIENHSLSHQWYFSLLGPRRIYREIHSAQIVLNEICGEIPRFFRPTAGLRNPLLDPILAHCGLRLCTWSKRGFDTMVNNSDAVLESLVHELKGGDILLLHDGSAARNDDGIPVILDVLPRLLDKIEQAKLHAVTLRSAMP
jgi:peptidoglycan/xylan/chitin deacetylase (PgdA/CDA1 family)